MEVLRFELTWLVLDFRLGVSEATLFCELNCRDNQFRWFGLGEFV